MNGPLQRGNVCPVLEASPAPAHLWLHEDSWGVDSEGRERGTPFMGPLVSGCSQKGGTWGSPEEHLYEDAGVRVMELSAVSYGGEWSHARWFWGANSLSFIGSFLHSFTQPTFLRPPRGPSPVLGAGEVL